MRALTVRQPWAWAIIHGGKDVENRTRNVAGAFRGPLAIHAGLAKFEQHNMASRAHRAAHGSEVPTELVYGGIIGVVDLVDVHIETPTCCDSPWAERVTRYDDHPIHHLVRENPRPLAEPIPCRGALGLWNLPDDVAAAVHEQLS